jgi:hypothetical protein
MPRAVGVVKLLVNLRDGFTLLGRQLAAEGIPVSQKKRASFALRGAISHGDFAVLAASESSAPGSGPEIHVGVTVIGREVS